MFKPLLSTKLLVPAHRTELVSRRHLIEVLDKSLGCKFTVVSAPAGYGKTTLIGEWINQRNIPTAWLSLDENDNDPIRFLSYIIKALQTISPNWGETILDFFQSPQAQINEPLLITLINEISSTISDEFIFVLDDYHLVESQKIHEIITFMLNHLPPSMHMVIATRSDPSLPVALLRGRGELIELRQSDLRFTVEEAAEFLNGIKGLQLTNDQIAALATRTEGWISGLQMAAISIQGSESISAFVESFTGSNRYIFDYLIEEILNRQPENIQEFLLHTSILDRLTGDLCNAVMNRPDNQAILDYLDRANLFIVPLDKDRQWYRYHNLFADLLRKQLMQKRPELIRTLHQRAGAWFEKEGLSEDAITHALAARDYDLAALILEQTIPALMGRGEMSLIDKFFGLLPGEMIRSRPILSLQLIWGLAFSGRLEEAEAKLQEIENQPDIGKSKDVLGNVSLILALIANIRGDMGTAISLAHQADDLLPPESVMIRSMIPYILGNGYLAIGNLIKAELAFEQIKQIGIATNNLWTKIVAYHSLAQLRKLGGQLKEAQALCEEVIQIATDRGAERYGFLGGIYFELGDVLRERNNLESARKMVVQALESLESWRIPTDLVMGYITLARICLAQADLENADNAIREAQRVIGQGTIFSVIQKKLDACQIQLWLQQGNLIDASRWADEIEAKLNNYDQKKTFDFVSEMEFISLVRVWIARGSKEKVKSSLDKANHLLSRLADSAQESQRFGRLIEIVVLQAIVLDQLGKGDKALETIEKGISLARNNGYVRIFLDEGLSIQRILHRAQKKGIDLPYMGKLLSEFDNQAPELPVSTTTALPEPLSDREKEVLKLLPSGMTAGEMAERLIVAKSTIDTHVKHIYSKLGVNRRMDAIQRAKELGLL